MSKSTTKKASGSGKLTALSRGERRFVRRDNKGAFNESDRVGRTLAPSGKITITVAEYERLRAAAGEGPKMPKADASGNLPAVEYMRASIARRVIEQRNAAGMSQQQLADLAGVRQETISRIESGKHTVTERVMAKIEKALTQAAKQARYR